MRRANAFVVRAGAFIGCAVMLSVVAPLQAFELATHGQMTLKAYQMTNLASSPEAYRRLGLDGWVLADGTSGRPFNTSFVDIGSELRKRSTRPYEEDFFPRNTVLGFDRNADSLKSYSWLMRGAIREDDTPFISLLSNDDPVNAIRPLNHFFDPVHNLPLTLGGQIGGTQLGRKNPDWALGTVDFVASGNVRDDLRDNHYSAFDAREAMWRALTLRDKNMSPDISVAGIANGEPLRKAYWATTFRTLGDLVHMIQDMAQPQHTRNEPHLGRGPGTFQANAAGHGSIFEHYVETRALGTRPSFEVNVGSGSQVVSLGVIPPALNFGNYPIPRFNKYSDYFSTSVASSTNPGLGIADYSNRRFFTQAKNLGHPDFTLPTSSPGAYGTCNKAVTKWDGTPLTSGEQVTLLCAPRVVDELNPSIDDLNVALTSKSILDEFLVDRGAPATYHLVRENYDEQAKLLLPRAVAYSAGIIDYFFRGTMQISLPDDGVYAVMDQSQFTPVNSSSGFTKVKLKLANTTPPIGTGPTAAQDMTGGRLVAVAKFRRTKTTYSTDLTGDCGAPNQSFPACRGDAEDIVTSVAVNSVSLPAGGAPQEFQFTFSEAIPLNVTDLYLQVVYRGPLGSEADAVVVTTKNIPEPTYLSIFNLTDSVACYKGGWIKLNADGSVPAATAATIVAEGYNPASLAPQTFVRSSVTFKGPFTYPLSANGPLATANDIAPGRYYRLAILTDDQKAFDYDIETYQFYTERPLTTAANSIDYDTGSANTMSTYLTKIRDANTFVYRFGYRFLGGDCANTASPPLDASTADGGTFATPTLVPVNTIAF